MRLFYVRPSLTLDARKRTFTFTISQFNVTSPSQPNIPISHQLAACGEQHWLFANMIGIETFIILFSRLFGSLSQYWELNRDFENPNIWNNTGIQTLNIIIHMKTLIKTWIQKKLDFDESLNSYKDLNLLKS